MRHRLRIDVKRLRYAADALSQSCSLLSQPEHLAFEYTRAMVAVLLLWEPQPRPILLIGVGGGSIPMAVTAVQPGSDIDAVDIDEAVLTVAQRYFGLRPGPRLRLHALDGREFVSAARAREAVYDAVLLDAFDAEGSGKWLNKFYSLNDQWQADDRRKLLAFARPESGAVSILHGWRLPGRPGRY